MKCRKRLILSIKPSKALLSLDKGSSERFNPPKSFSNRKDELLPNLMTLGLEDCGITLGFVDEAAQDKPHTFTLTKGYSIDEAVYNEEYIKRCIRYDICEEYWRSVYSMLIEKDSGIMVRESSIINKGSNEKIIWLLNITRLCDGVNLLELKEDYLFIVSKYDERASASIELLGWDNYVKADIPKGVVILGRKGCFNAIFNKSDKRNQYEVYTIPEYSWFCDSVFTDVSLTFEVSVNDPYSIRVFK